MVVAHHHVSGLNISGAQNCDSKSFKPILRAIVFSSRHPLFTVRLYSCDIQPKKHATRTGSLHYDSFPLLALGDPSFHPLLIKRFFFIKLGRSLRLVLSLNVLECCKVVSHRLLLFAKCIAEVFP